ncbi:MAG: DUF697 domain-containing protein [Kaiparowitsia implicata GSE-PSE-MK54-09C]|jgi:GTPase SAR1 family protein|nr:DUF697 domain-containing protein [Kaiparowitsia implicata GSE-PSE-MK54-09C]
MNSIGMKQPILVGGLGITAGALVLNWLTPGVVHSGEAVTLGMLALSGVWWLKQRQRLPLDLSTEHAPLDRPKVEQAIAHLDTLIQQLQQELPTVDGLVQDNGAIARLKATQHQLTQELDRPALNLTLLGHPSTGKSTLAQELTTRWLPTLNAAVTVAEASIPESMSALAAADIVVWLTNGDLTDSELQPLRQLVGRKHRVIVALNKQDHFLPEERSLVLSQIRERVMGLLPVRDVVAIAAAPIPLKVRQHQPDGTVQERWDQPDPDVASLTQMLTPMVTTDAQTLILTTVMRQVQDATTAVYDDLNQIRRDRALPIIEKAQWIAAAAAFANPMASLDLVATAAINIQMVSDLGALYHQRISLDHAGAIAGDMAEIMIKLGLVELSSQAIAPVLKSHALTYMAGGALQGLSAAYLTRVAGLSLVEYFQEQRQMQGTTANAPLSLERLSQTVKAVFTANQRVDFIKSLVNQGLQRLSPAAQPAPVALHQSEHHA